MTSFRLTQKKSFAVSPLDLYPRLGVTLIGRGDWRTAACPFHNDKHPSMRVNATHGGFWCPACGAKGSMIDFYMEMMCVPYSVAIQELGEM